MKRTFDQICADILGETLTPNPNQPQQGQPQQGQQQASPTYQKTPPINQKPQQGDDELLKLLQQRMQNDQNNAFKKSLEELIKAQQQPNAGNQPTQGA